MYLLYCDETNIDPAQADFFVYGGISIPGRRALELSNAIEAIRTAAEIDSAFQVKFNPGPDHLSHPEFTKLKQDIIEAAVEHQCRLFVSMILHNIATSPDDARRNEINRIVYHFNCYLHRPNSHGLVLIDRFTDRQIDAHLREKFSIGLTGDKLPFAQQLRLDRIVGYHYSAIGQSHFSSLIDIVIGSFRFAVNALKSGKGLPTARKLLRLLAPLFYRDPHSQEVHEISMFFSPKRIKVDKYRKQYESLKAFMAENGIPAAQAISA